MPSADVSDDTTVERFFSALRNIDFSNNKKVIVALSGGSDSMAMALILKAYLDQSSTGISMIAVTLDHGLRAGSAREARLVHDLCAGLGIQHEIMTWTGEKPITAIQRIAREKRYALLSDAARRHGCNLIFTGHTFDDCMETIAMRNARRGSLSADLGIAPFTLFANEIWFARPLLGWRKAELRHLLEVMDAEWIEDPSNQNVKFERVHIRQNTIVPDFSDERAGVADRAKQNALHGAALLDDEQLVQFSAHGPEVWLHRDAFGHSGYWSALAALLAMIGRTEYLPNIRGVNSQPQIAALFDAASNNAKFTFNRCLMSVVKPYVKITPETRNHGDGRFGFDYILPSHHFVVAQALRRRLGLFDLPPVPLKALRRG